MVYILSILLAAIGVSMDTDSHDSVNSNPSASGDSGSRGRGMTITTGSISHLNSLMNSQEQLYQKRCDEGYNLIVDSEYLHTMAMISSSRVKFAF